MKSSYNRMLETETAPLGDEIKVMIMNGIGTQLVNFLLILLCLIAAGCSQTPKDPLTVNDPPDNPTDLGSFKPQYQHARSRLKFKSNRLKNPSLQNTVWDRLLSLYSLPETDNARIDKEIDWYLQHPAALSIIQKRAEPYLHHILNEVEAKNIPGELALLPVVESAFVPDAYSHASASGLWQFIPSTGEEYGLRQNDWYDGRRDVYASTKAATTYLKELSETFDGDWLLALASYNCGKNRVKKSMEYNENRRLPTDFWSLNLPKETLDYVPKLLAVAKIFAHAEDYNLHLERIPNKPYFEVVDVKSPIDLHKAAQLANTPYDKFMKLNPGFNRSCTAPEGPHHLLIPINNVQTFKYKLAQLSYDERIDLNQLQREKQHLAARRATPKLTESKPVSPAPIHDTRYKIKTGDTLLSIAKKSDTTVSEIRRLNRLKGDTARLGAYIKLPDNGKAVVAYTAKKQPINVKRPSLANAITYTVKPGDTLWNISQRFSVSAKDLAAWNNMSLKSALVAGKKISLKPTSRQQYASASTSVRLIHYTVKKGDSLTGIARKFNVSIGDLQKSNPDLPHKGGVRYGQKLKIIVSGQSPT